jgi:hypothetical protein
MPRGTRYTFSIFAVHKRVSEKFIWEKRVSPRHKIHIAWSKVLLTSQFVHTFSDRSTNSPSSGQLCDLPLWILFSQGMNGWGLVNPSHSSSERRECTKILYNPREWHYTRPSSICRSISGNTNNFTSHSPAWEGPGIYASDCLTLVKWHQRWATVLSRWAYLSIKPCQRSLQQFAGIWSRAINTRHILIFSRNPQIWRRSFSRCHLTASILNLGIVR